MDLSSRKMQILQAIIDDYIMSGVPVGSRTISKKYNMGLSSATIRNEMSDLEELGFLDQPHISSGRVPSFKAYRLYVDTLINSGDLGNNNIEIRKHFSSHAKRIEDVVTRATQVLSELTNYTAIALLPDESSDTIRNLQLVPVSANTALFVIVMSSGKIHHKIINISPLINKNTLDNISSTLTERLSGKPINNIHSELTDVLTRLNINSEFLNDINASMESFFDDKRRGNILRTMGTSNLFNYPEYLSIDKAKNLLSLLDEQNEIVNLMKQKGELSFTVHIGPEIGIDEMSDCTMITASYSTKNDAKGTIGIIGPTRMPYKHVIEILGNIGQELTKILDEDEE